MHLSVVIPTYNGAKKLAKLLGSFSGPMKELANEVEVIVCDDCSTEDTKSFLDSLPQEQQFFKYVGYEENIGLEQNLIKCVDYAKGEYVWIFGDDDFLETPESLFDIVELLKSDQYGMLVLNRTRRSESLEQLISADWMGIAEQDNKEYENVTQFFLDWGLISTVGFITVNIMRRELFTKAVDERFYGTMYPQLGALADAFSDTKVLLLSQPIVCHRTQTAEEKAASFSNKDKEKTFMSDVQRRDAMYFGSPFLRMINILVEKGALTWNEINKINENTVINGRLVDFLVSNIVKAVNFGIDISQEDQDYINTFANKAELTPEQIYQLSRYTFIDGDDFAAVRKPVGQGLSISVVTPSYNQVEFFYECLDAVYDQTYRPLEHIVLDPGSNDGSLNVARYYRNVTLVNEPDEGQGDAVAKGIQMAKGEVIAWVNSDDRYYDNQVFENIAEEFKPDDEIIYGDGDFLAGSGEYLRDVYVNKDPSTLNWRFQQEDGIFQPALFFRKSISEKIGLPSKYLEYCMDYEYWIRAMKEGISFRYIERKLAKAYFHIDNKTYGQRGKSYEQVCSMLFEQFGYANHFWLRRYAEYLAHGLDGVLATSVNSEGIDQAAIDIEYRQLMTRFNTSFDVVALLKAREEQKGYGDTYRELKAMTLIPSHAQLLEGGEPNSSESIDYSMGGRDWRYKRAWKNEQLKKSHAFFHRAIEKKQNDSCVIVCNGPSLREQDKSIFKDFDVIASNNIFLDEEIMSYVDYYTCVNYLVAEQSAPGINNLECFKVLPWWLAYCVNPSENTFFVEALGRPEFSTDFFKNMSWRHTVTFFNMHLAYGLGYKKVCIVGCDHSYSQPKNIEEGETIHDDGDDENHFDPRYFKSKKWQAADVDKMEEMYLLAKTAFEADGREIVNCTVGGELELFRRSTLEQERNLNPECKARDIIYPFTVGPFERADKVHFDETQLVAEYLHEESDGLMLDVGAHHGYAASPFLDKGWDVVGFEPDPNNRKILIERLGQNDRLTIYDKAVSDESGKIVSFYASDESTGISGLSKFRESHEEICEVETTTLADVMQASEISQVDFLKIDTEGFDLMVLKGFPWHLTLPKVIECEFEDSKTVPLGYDFDDIANYLQVKGYHVYVSEWHPVVRYGIQHQWKSLRRYPCELSDAQAWGNLIAFSEKPDEKALLGHLTKLAELDSLKCNDSKKSPSMLKSVKPGHDKMTFFKFRRGIEWRLRQKSPALHAFGLAAWRIVKKARNLLR